MVGKHDPGVDVERRAGADRQTDAMFRSSIFNVNQTASTVDLRVHDITNLSEIFIDNLVINAGQELAVPEPSSIAIVLVAVSGL